MVQTGVACNEGQYPHRKLEEQRSASAAQFYSVLTCTGHGWSQDREKPQNGTGFSLLQIWSLPCMCVVYMCMDVHPMGMVVRGQQWVIPQGLPYSFVLFFFCYCLFVLIND